jgi:hypothetical protein
MNKLDLKKIKLGEELENSCKQIIAGIKELQTTVQDTDYYFIAFQLLDNGFERLLKCVICYGWLEQYNKFPTVNQIKGHDINVLLQNFLNNYFSQATSELKQDYKFLSTNKDAKIIIKSLSEFGNYGRYHNLNVVTGVEKTVDITEIWDKLQMDYIRRKPQLIKKMTIQPDLEFVENEVTKYVVSIIEKITRATVRQFTLGKLGNEPNKYIGFYSHFLYLKDTDIGNTNYYDKFFSKKVNDPIVYVADRKNKTMVVKKEVYNGLWPFKNTNEVILEKKNELCVFIIINNKKYALNGFTNMNYNLPFPHDCGEAFKGRDIDAFITMAQNM